MTNSSRDSVDSPPSSTKPDVKVGKPDSLRGWLVVSGCFFSNAAVFGNLNTFGIYLEAYRHTWPSHSNSQLALIGSLHGFLILSGGIWVPTFIVPRLGSRMTVLVGALLEATGYVLASLATQIWHLYLCQSVLVGLGSALMVFPILPLPPQWFIKRRGLANGVSVLGSSLGTLTLSILVRFLISTTGPAWTLRIMAGVLLGFGVFAALVIKDRVPITPPKFKALLKQGFLNRRIICLAVFTLFGNFAYFAVVFFVPSYARFIGLDANTGAWLVSLLMSFNAAACISMGALADRFGRLLTLKSCITLAAVTCGLVWPFVNSLYLMMLFVSLYGVALGGFLSLPNVIIAELVDNDHLRGVIGLFYAVNSVGGFIGPSLLASLLDLTSGKSYLPAQIYACFCYLVGLSALFILARFQ